MKIFNSGKIVSVAATLALAFFLFFFSTTQAQAQNENAAQADDLKETATPGDRRDELTRLLALTPDQLGRIRAIREQNKEERRALTLRLREAQRALDQAIYVDNADEAVVEQRAKEVAQAQSEVVRLRALTELNIRRVLTPAQLNTLRALRQQARAVGRERRLERREERSLRPDNLQQPERPNRPRAPRQ